MLGSRHMHPASRLLALSLLAILLAAASPAFGGPYAGRAGNVFLTRLRNSSRILANRPTS